MKSFVKWLLPFLVTCCFSLSASAQFVTVNAQLIDGTGSLSPTSFLRFSLYNCGSNLPVYSAGNLVMIKKQFDLKPGASGQISGLVVPNDKILCGGVASTLWTITPMKDALTPIQPAQMYDILSSNGIFNLATAMPTNPSLAPPGFVVIFGNPTLSQTINQPAGTTMTFLGTFDFTQATVLGLAPSGSTSNSPFSTGTTPCVPYYSGTANGCDTFIQTNGTGDEQVNSVTATTSLNTPLINTSGPGYVKVFKTQSTPCTAQTGFMCWYGDSITLKWICLNSDGSSCAAPFVGQGAKSYGREQLSALLLGAAVLYTIARVLNELLDGKPHWDRPFSLIYREKEYSLRTVQGDIYRAATDLRGFLYSRINPIARMGIEAATARDEQGHPRELQAQLKDYLKENAPIPAQPFLRPSLDSNRQRFADALLRMAGVSEKIYLTSAEEEAAKIARRKGSGTYTEEQDAKYWARQKALEGLRKGDSSALEDGLDKRLLSADDIAKLIHRVPLSKLADKVHQFTFEELMQVYEKADDEQQEELLPLLLEKQEHMLEVGEIPEQEILAK